MKLPQYDNSTPAGTPLYSSDTAKSEWEDIKFPALAIGIPIGILMSLGLVAFAIVRLLY